MLGSLAYVPPTQCLPALCNSVNWFVFVMEPRYVYSEEEKNIYTLLHKPVNLPDIAHAHSQNILTFCVRILLMLEILAVPAHDALRRHTLSPPLQPPHFRPSTVFITCVGFQE